MNFTEAMQLIKEGKKIRRRCWNPDQWVSAEGKEIKWQNGKQLSLTLSQIDAEDWEVVENKEIPIDRLNMTEEERIGYISALDDIEEIIKNARKNLKEMKNG